MSSAEVLDIASLPLARRVVTGNDDQNKSQLLYDDSHGNIRTQTLWFTDGVPADCSSETSQDPTGNQTFEICNEGSVCMTVWMKPGASSPMHQTKSIDYGVVLEGEIILEMESGDERLLKIGDVVVQRETLHAWHNRHPKTWAKLFFVLIASKDAESNSEISG